MGALFPFIQSTALKWLGVAAMLVAVVTGSCRYGESRGAARVTTRWAAEKAQMQSTLQQLAARQAQTTAQVLTQYVERVQVVHEAARAITEKVPVYVSRKDDAACTVNAGFVRVHDAAVRGELPGAPAEADAAPSGVALSAVARTVAGNYGTCHEVAEQLKALQAWVRQQERVHMQAQTHKQEPAK